MSNPRPASSRAKPDDKSRKRDLLHEVACRRMARKARIFNYLVSGMSHNAIARFENCSIQNVRKIIAQELDARQIEPAGDFAKLQIARLNDALTIVYGKMTLGHEESVDRWLKVVAQLDRYYGLAQAMTISRNFGGERAALPAPQTRAPASLPAPAQHAEESEVLPICASNR